MEFNSTATSFTGGADIFCFFVPASSNQVKAASSVSLAMRMPVVVDALTDKQIPVLIVAEGIGGTSAVRASINWREIR
jgi:hypothetical protein